MTIYAAGPAGSERPALDALRRVIADNGGLSGVYRVTLSWQAVDPDGPRAPVLAAARRAVEDPRAVAYVDAAGGPASVPVVQLLNEAGVAVAHVASPTLGRQLCESRDPYPGGDRTAGVPAGQTAADRARSAGEAIFEVLRTQPLQFDRAAITAGLVPRLARC